MTQPSTTQPLLANGGQSKPISYNIGLLLERVDGHGLSLPERFQALEELIPAQQYAIPP